MISTAGPEIETNELRTGVMFQSIATATLSDHLITCIQIDGFASIPNGLWDLSESSRNARLSPENHTWVAELVHNIRLPIYYKFSTNRCICE
jgi:hypothetical protein